MTADPYAIRLPAVRTLCETPLRPAVAAEVPRSAKAAQRAAQAAGWSTQPTFARGWRPVLTTAGRPRTVGSTAIRCERVMTTPYGRTAIVEAAAVWILDDVAGERKWTFDAAWIGTPFRSYGANEWKTAISGEYVAGLIERGWMDGQASRDAGADDEAPAGGDSRHQEARHD